MNPTEITFGAQKMTVKIRLLIRQLLIFAVALFFGREADAVDGLATKSITAGPWNSIVVRSDGSVWGWGYNQFGETGDWMPILGLQPTASPNPIQMNSAFTKVVAVAGGGWDDYISHTLV